MVARERLRASWEAIAGSKKRIRRGWEEVDIFADCWWGVEGLFCWFWCRCCEVGSDGLLDDECARWRVVVVKVAFCRRLQSRRAKKRKCLGAREDMNL